MIEARFPELLGMILRPKGPILPAVIVAAFVSRM
jgi:hypothetical protein